MTIGLMSAMPEEADLIARHLTNTRQRLHGGRTYTTGRLEVGVSSIPVVLVYSRIGKVAAAATAQHLIDSHGVSAIIFTGVAGALRPDLAIGDIVIADELWQHDMDASPIFPPLEIPLLGVSSFQADPALAVRLRAAAETFIRDDLHAHIDADARRDLRLQAPRVIVGGVSSGDRFVSTRAERDAILRRIPRALCCEMEGAAVAQVCHEHDVSFAVVRVMSDSADESAAVDFGRFIRDAASHYGLGIIRRFLAPGF